MGSVDKQSVISSEIRQYCTGLKPGDIGKYVLLPGDPARSDRASKYLDNAEFIGMHREHRTFTGYYKGVKVSVTSTGLGCPSASIATQELINIGAEAVIRIGSSAALDPKIKVGDLLISTGAMKNEGTSKFFVPDAFPAVPDFELTYLLIQQAKAALAGSSTNVHAGIGSTDDSFYGETPEFIDRVYSYGCVNLDMEASAIFTTAHILKKKAAAIYSISSNLKSGEIYYADGTKEEDNQKLADGWDTEIQIALETFYQYENLKEHLI